MFGRKVRITYPFHPRYGEYAEAVGRSLHGLRPVLYRDGVVGYLEAHEWEWEAA